MRIRVDGEGIPDDGVPDSPLLRWASLQSAEDEGDCLVMAFIDGSVRIPKPMKQYAALKALAEDLLKHRPNKA